MRACARANGAMHFCPQAASGIISEPPPSTDPSASRRSVTPISRGHANALGFQHPGAFFFGVRAKDIHTINTRLHRAPEASWLLLARGRENREGAKAPCLDASARAAAGCTRNELGFLTRRQCGTSTNDPQRNGLACPSGARGTAVAYAGGRETVFREATLAQLGRAAVRLQVTGSNPVRHHWIAQLGRASDC